MTEPVGGQGARSCCKHCSRPTTACWLEALCGLRAQAGHGVGAHSVDLSLSSASQQLPDQQEFRPLLLWRFVAASRKKDHGKEGGAGAILSGQVRVPPLHVWEWEGKAHALCGRGGGHCACLW